MADELVLHTDVEAETGVLGCLLLDADGCLDICRKMIGARDPFCNTSNGIIYRGILAAAGRQPKKLTLNHVMDALEAAGMLDKCGGRRRLLEIISTAPTSTMIDYYLGRVVKSYLRRQAVVKLSQVVQNITTQTEPCAILEDVTHALTDLSDMTTSTMEKRLAEVVDDAEHYIQLQASGGGGGLKTGFTQFDRILRLRPGETTVIAGRPSTGKTTLALDIARYVAESEHVPVGIASLEMETKMLAVRLLCGKATVRYAMVRDPGSRTSALQRLSAAKVDVKRWDIIVDDNPNVGIYDIRASARRMKNVYDIGLYVVDYMQIIRPTDRRQNREAQVAEISRNLKGMAKDLHIPVVVLAQLNRLAETEKPRASHLRESGAIEQDADVIILLHCDRQAERVQGGLPVEAAIAKQRNGATGVANLLFYDGTTHFVDAPCTIKPAMADVDNDNSGEGQPDGNHETQQGGDQREF